MNVMADEKTEDLDSAIQLSKQAFHYDFQDRLFVLNIESKRLYTTHGLGRAILLLLAKQAVSENDLARAIETMFTLPADVARKDVSEFLASARENGLISYKAP